MSRSYSGERQHIVVYEAALTAAFCKEVMAKFDADARVEADPQPDYSTRKFLNISHCADWRSVNMAFCRVADELVSAYFARDGVLSAATYQETSDDGYIVCRYDPGDDVIMHVDGQSIGGDNNGLRIATLLFYLNDVPEGGETWFPEQDIKVQPRLGRAVMFPVGYTHPHSVLKAKSPRYIMQTWITDPSLVVVPS